MLPCIRKGWFTEVTPEEQEWFTSVGESDGPPPDKKKKGFDTDDENMGEAWPGQAFSLKVEQVLFHEKSKYQDVLVFKSTDHGNVLVLDNIIQCTERDEFSYQEMLAHLPLFAHPNPKTVLIIGGGDGGILREVVKHDCVESVVMCEIDQVVIDVSKKYLPHMAQAFDHPKLTLNVGDGFKFLRENTNKFDVIITDSSDPIGPAKDLFGEPYYELIKAALTENGVLSSQAESFWLHLDLIEHMVKFCRGIYARVSYATGFVSTYPSGTIGYLLCSKDSQNDLRKPKRRLDDSAIKKMQLRYYNSDVHESAFVLPQFVKQAVDNA